MSGSDPNSINPFVLKRNRVQKSNAAAEEQYAKDEKAKYDAKRNESNRAYSAFLEGLGCTVK